MLDRCHLLRLVDGGEVEWSVAAVGALVHVAGVLQQPLQQSLVIVLGSEIFRIFGYIEQAQYPLSTFL